MSVVECAGVVLAKGRWSLGDLRERRAEGQERDYGEVGLVERWRSWRGWSRVGDGLSRSWSCGR